MKFVYLLFSLYAAVCHAATASSLRQAVASLKGSIVRITSNNYESLLNGPRDYDLVVLITASDARMGCGMCVSYGPTFLSIALEYVKKSKGEGDLFFAVLDFSERTKIVFQKLQLQNVPKVYHYPKTTESVPLTKGYTEMQFLEGNHGDNTVRWLKTTFSGKKFSVPQPPLDYANILLTAGVTALCALVVFRNRTRVASKLLGSTIWALGSIMAILLFVSGYMFNQIRNTQYMQSGPEGKPVYFVEGHQTQLGVETQVISFVYGALSLMFVVLVTKIPEARSLKSNRLLQSGLTVVACGGIFLAFSLLLSIFSKKMGGYPFGLVSLSFF